MVKEVRANNGLLYVCEECHFKYRDQEWAEQCQAWCKEHQSCNLEIIQHTVTEEGGDRHE